MLLVFLAALGPGASAASAVAPTIGAVWVSSVQPTTARLNAEVDPRGKSSSYHVDYITRAAYDANLSAGRDGFLGTSRLPVASDANIPGTSPTTIGPSLFGLTPGTAYRYRLVVTNADGSDESATQTFATHSAAPFALPDSRGWEMVSPVEKNGGQVADPAEAGAGAYRAAAQGGGVAYASRASFAGGAGAAPFSQYLATRTASGWQTQNITPPHLVGAYQGAPYVAFSADLARSLYLNPARCPDGDPCPPGYRLRDNLTGALTLSPADPGLLAAASQSLLHIVFTEAGELYRWSPPAGLIALGAAPPVSLTAPQGALSNDGQRVYYEGADANLYLRDGAMTRQVDAAAGGGGSFETATPDGATALYTKAGQLYRYLAATGASEDLIPAGGVLSDSARISPDGTKVLFASTAPLTTSDGERYDNTGLGSGLPESQVYLYDSAGAGTLTCVSCNPTHSRPLGPSSVPAAAGPHEPRVLSADGRRVFIESEDALVLSDVNLDTDVYQWTAQGAGSCTRSGGCIAPISSGLADRATFVDASADGGDAFFLTDRSLVFNDPGSIDLYDARVGGGFPEPVEPPLCVGDACQVVPPAPEDPTLTTVLPGPGNPAERYRTYGARAKKRCPKGKRLKTVRRRDGKRVKKCVKKAGKRAGKKRGGRG